MILIRPQKHIQTSQWTTSQWKLNRLTIESLQQISEVFEVSEYQISGLLWGYNQEAYKNWCSMIRYTKCPWRVCFQKQLKVPVTSEKSQLLLPSCLGRDFKIQIQEKHQYSDISHYPELAMFFLKEKPFFFFVPENLPKFLFLGYKNCDFAIFCHWPSDA